MKPTNPLLVAEMSQQLVSGGPPEADQAEPIDIEATIVFRTLDGPASHRIPAAVAPDCMRSCNDRSEVGYQTLRHLAVVKLSVIMHRVRLIRGPLTPAVPLKAMFPASHRQRAMRVRANANSTTSVRTHTLFLISESNTVSESPAK